MCGLVLRYRIDALRDRNSENWQNFKIFQKFKFWPFQRSSEGGSNTVRDPVILNVMFRCVFRAKFSHFSVFEFLARNSRSGFIYSHIDGISSFFFEVER